MDKEEINNRFVYHPISDEDTAVLFRAIRIWGKRFSLFILEHVPGSRERVEAVNRIDEAVMWANAAIARHAEQKDVSGSAEDGHHSSNTSAPEPDQKRDAQPSNPIGPTTD